MSARFRFVLSIITVLLAVVPFSCSRRGNHTEDSAAPVLTRYVNEAAGGEIRFGALTGEEFGIISETTTPVSRFVPAASVTGKGIRVTVNAKDLIQEYLVSLTIKFDPDMFIPKSVIQGDFMGAQNKTIFFSLLDRSGELPIAIARILPDLNGYVSGSGRLLEIEFEQRTPLLAAGADEGQVIRTPAKLVSGAPVADSRNVVNVIATETGLRWDEARAGDWDNDGTVKAIDIGPIALNFGQSANPVYINYYKYTSYIDGNGTWTVDAGDVSAIAFHFGESTGGYNIYEADDVQGTGRTKVASINRPPVPADPENPPTSVSYGTLTYDTAAGNAEPPGWTPTPGKWYQVVPFDTGSPPQESGTVKSPLSLSSPAWAHTWGSITGAYDYANGIAADSGGSLYIAGTTAMIALEDEDALVLKYDPTGTLSWVKTWGLGGSDLAGSILVNGVGNVYVGGLTASFGAGLDDALLLKYDSAGNLLWARIWGGSRYDDIGSVASDSQGNIYGAGTTDSFGAGLWDVLLLKYDPDGNTLWAKTWGTSADDDASDIYVDEQDNIYLLAASGDFYENLVDVCLLKYDSSGTLLWSKSWTVSDKGHPTSMTVAQDGSIYVCGSLDDLSGWSTDALILKFDSSGNILWGRRWDGGDYDDGFDIAVDLAGNINLVGTSWPMAEGQSDLFYLKYDNQGNCLWSWWWGDYMYDDGYAIAFDPSGNVFIAGDGMYGQGLGRSVTGVSGSVTVTASSVVGTETSPSGVTGSPAGNDTVPSGFEDTGGPDDLLVIKNFP